MEVRNMSEDDGETKKIHDFVFSLYQRNLISTTVYIEKLKEIENANRGELVEVCGILNIYLMNTFLLVMMH